MEEVLKQGFSTEEILRLKDPEVHQQVLEPLEHTLELETILNRQPNIGRARQIMDCKVNKVS